MNAVDELLAFVRACLDEDERVARAAANGERDPFDGSGIIVMPVHGGTTRSVTLTSSVATHIARWDPARVLAEIEAKRRILAMYDAIRDEVRNPVSAEHRANARARQHQMEELLPLLAQPYAGRPGWREEWQA